MRRMRQQGKKCVCVCWRLTRFVLPTAEDDEFETLQEEKNRMNESSSKSQSSVLILFCCFWLELVSLLLELFHLTPSSSFPAVLNVSLNSPLLPLPLQIKFLSFACLNLKTRRVGSEEGLSS